MDWFYLIFIDNVEIYYLSLLVFSVCYWLLCLLNHAHYDIQLKDNSNPYPSKQEQIQKVMKDYQKSQNMLYWLCGFVFIFSLFIVFDSNVQKPNLSKAIYYIKNQGKHHQVYNMCVTSLGVELSTYKQLNSSDRQSIDNKLIVCLQANDMYDNYRLKSK